LGSRWRFCWLLKQERTCFKQAQNTMHQKGAFDHKRIWAIKKTPAELPWQAFYLDQAEISVDYRL
jgi:hypothetical protein